MEIAVNINEAARRAGVGRTTIYEAAQRGELKIRKNGQRSLILVKDLEAWLNAMPEAKLSKIAA